MPAPSIHIGKGAVLNLRTNQGPRLVSRANGLLEKLT